MIMPDVALTISVVSKNRPGAEANIELSYTSGTFILADLNLVGPNAAKRITHGKWSNYFTETTFKLTQHPIISIMVLYILTDQSFYNQCDPVSIFFFCC